MRRRLRFVLGWLLAAATLIGAYVAYQLITDNFHEVIPGEVYRAGQMDDDDLEDHIERYRIRSILNLRGTNPAVDWYRVEVGVSTRLGVVHHDRAWSSRVELSPEEIADVVHLMRTAPKPMLIHCSGGADRTALASALYRFSVAGDPADRAARELSPWYGHLPWIRPRVRAMDRTFWAHVGRSTNAAADLTRTSGTRSDPDGPPSMPDTSRR